MAWLQLNAKLKLNPKNSLFRFRDFFPTVIIDISLLLATACVVGAIHGTGWDLVDVPGNAVMAQTAVATLTGVTFLRTFTKVRALFHLRTHVLVPVVLVS